VILLLWLQSNVVFLCLLVVREAVGAFGRMCAYIIAAFVAMLTIVGLGGRSLAWVVACSVIILIVLSCLFIISLRERPQKRRVEEAISLGKRLLRLSIYSLCGAALLAGSLMAKSLAGDRGLALMLRVLSYATCALYLFTARVVEPRSARRKEFVGERDPSIR
jgi:hypothetical protein